MKPNFPYLFVLLGFNIIFSSCEKDNPEPTPVVLEVKTASDIPADAAAQPGSAPNYTLFSLNTGEIISKADSNSTKWDIALAGTSILLNGGKSGPGQGAALIVENIFEELTEAPAEGYTQDSENGLGIPAGSGNGWYTYTGGGNPPNAILPIPGRIIVLKTADGKYAKLEILSYYKGNPDTSSADFMNMEKRSQSYPSRHYTFRYVVQQDGTRNF